MDLLHLLAVVTTLVTGLMAGNELAVIAFFHPALYGLPDEAHVRSAKEFAIRLGKAMPFWYALTLILLGVLAWQLSGVNRFAFGMVCAAAVLMAIVIVFTIACMVPINNRIGALNVEALPEGWKSDRRKWDEAHLIRVVALVLVFALLVFGLVSLIPQP